MARKTTLPASPNSAEAVSRLLTAEQLSSAIQDLSVQEINRSRVLYGLPVIKLGPKKFRYRLEDVLSWLESRRTSTVKEDRTIAMDVIARILTVVSKRGEGDLSDAVNDTTDPLDRRILSTLGAIRVAMDEGMFYQAHSALTKEPTPRPINSNDAIYPDIQAVINGLAASLHQRVLSMLEDLPRVNAEITTPTHQFSISNNATGVADHVQSIAILIATIQQLQEINKTKAGPEK